MKSTVYVCDYCEEESARFTDDDAPVDWLHVSERPLTIDGETTVYVFCGLECLRSWAL